MKKIATTLILQCTAIVLSFSSIPLFANEHNNTADHASDILALFGSPTKALPQSAPLMTNVRARNVQSLNGRWNIMVDEHDAGERRLFGGSHYDMPLTDNTGMVLRENSFDKRRQLKVPGDWNTQDPTLFRYRGTVWYQRNFETTKQTDQRYFIHFDAVNYDASIYLNGQPVASHRGGYTAFNVEVTDQLQDGNNYLVVRVNATLDESTIPTRKTSDFFKYGGITRDVHLVTTPKTYIRQYHVYLADHNTGLIKAWVQLDGADAANQPISVMVADNDGDNKGEPQKSHSNTKTVSATTNALGRAEFEWHQQLTHWSPDNPKLYNVTIAAENQTLDDNIGFRTIATRGKQILLNGQPIYLRGISMHDESFLKKGVAFDKRDAKAQLDLVKELNGNFIRLAHYTHNEHTLRYADQMGLMVWSEIPIVSLIDWANTDTLALATTQLSDNIMRDLNRAAIITWSIANETMPQSQERLAFLNELALLSRKLDESHRPISAALVGNPNSEFAEVLERLVAELLNEPNPIDEKTSMQLRQFAKQHFKGDVQSIRNRKINVVLNDQLGAIVDIVGYNEYFGWYYSSLLAKLLPVNEAAVRETMFKIMADIRFSNIFGKPIIISEFGAGAKRGFTSNKGSGKLWSEEYQARVYRHQTDMLSRNEYVQGMSPWILKDFRSAMRELNGIQEIYNRKGIVSEKGKKKKAFYVLRDFYQQRGNLSNH